jgi:hypothetical protein
VTNGTCLKPAVQLMTSVNGSGLAGVSSESEINPSASVGPAL